VHFTSTPFPDEALHEQLDELLAHGDCRVRKCYTCARRKEVIVDLMEPFYQVKPNWLKKRESKARAAKAA